MKKEVFFSFFLFLNMPIQPSINIFNDQEIVKFRASISVDSLTNPSYSPNHKILILYIIEETLKGRKPDFQRFNESNINVREAYKDLMELLGDDDSLNLESDLETRIRIRAEKII